MSVTPSQEERGTRPVSLSLPVEGFVDVARLVVGGAASQFTLGFEAIDDIQLAVETILRAGLIDGDRAALELASDSESLAISIGPIRPAALDQPIVDAESKTIDPLALLRQLVDFAEPRREPAPVLILRKSLAPSA